MLTVRIDKELENKINRLINKTNKSKSEIVKQALTEYIEKVQEQDTPYETGKDLFGKYGSEEGTLSKNYKALIQEKLNEKYTN